MEKTRRISPMLSNGLLYGAIAAGLYIIWFFIMRAFGLHDSFRLRYMNFPILFTTTFICLNRMLKERNYKLPYLEGLGQSMLVGGLSVVFFGAFFFLYLTFIDPALMQHLQATAPFGWVMTPMSAAFWTGHELFGFQVLFSLISMEYFKFVQNRKGTLHNVNLAKFAERPARRTRGIVLMIIGVIFIIITAWMLISPDSYPHISGLLKIDEGNIYRVKWAPIAAAIFIALGIIQLSGSVRRRHIIQ